MKRIFVLMALILVFTVSCGEDDGPPGSQPPRQLTEVLVENNAEIVEFLETHFYNYEDFEEPISPDFDFEVIIDTIAGENASKTPLIQQVESSTVNVSDFEFGINVGERDVPHTFYYLEVKQGEGPSPTVADSIFAKISGRLLNGTVFQSPTIGSWFDLARLQAPQEGARGFSEGSVFFDSGGTPVTNPDGTFEVNDTGKGLVFLPSGLAFFNSTAGSLIPYNPVIFEIEILAMVTADHDQDGIPSIEEDLNRNGYLYDDNTDQAAEEEFGPRNPLVANLLDFDDDGDGILTRTEISDANGNIITPFPDTDSDGTPDYLDPDILRDPNN